MSHIAYQLGRLLGPKIRKTKWVWDSLTAGENEIIEAEYAVGRDMAAALARQMPLDTDMDAARCVVELGHRLADRLTNRTRQWAFHLAAADVANAWALPGGFIFITRPLIDLCSGNADELAFVLGHEMGHVVRGHAFDRLVSSTLLTAASKAAPLGRLVTPRVVEVGTRLMQSAYTQDQELEADLFGANLTASAGLDPAGSIRMMHRLAEQRSGNEMPAIFAYFSTHPPFETRMAALRKVVGSC